MFSPSFQIFNAHENASVRKRGQLKSARKPLADRGVNHSKINVDCKDTAAIKPKERVKVPEEDVIDTYSKKEVEDTYEDIWPKRERPTEEDIFEILSCISGFRQSQTPKPMRQVELEPILELAEVPMRCPHDDFQLDMDIAVEQIDYVDVPMLFEI